MRDEGRGPDVKGRGELHRGGCLEGIANTHLRSKTNAGPSIGG